MYRYIYVAYIYQKDDYFITE